ncbi:MAG: hypothetical protein LBM02_10370 [Lachnospiraceae bacterium]|jgi:hypothetical protein|nr:hypothetical protein [Lachnospiraceae bacterium]
MRKKIAVLLLCLSMYMPSAAFADTKDKTTAESNTGSTIVLGCMTALGVVLSVFDYYLYK